VVFRSLTEVEALIRASWSDETCDPVDRAGWSPENPSLGQCGVTALVVQDLLGGDLLMAEVHHADGSLQGVHYWNRFPHGVEVDLTREQFVGGEVIQAPAVVPRPPDTSVGRLAGQYAALAGAVRGALA
jgi:hypothetical protein